MASQILSGKSLLRPMEGCFRSSSLGHRSGNMQKFCCRAKTGGPDMQKYLAKTLHRRTTTAGNMKRFKLLNQDVLEELEEEEAENKSIQDFNMGDNSLADQDEDVLKTLNQSLNPSDNVRANESVMKILLENIGISRDKF